VFAFRQTLCASALVGVPVADGSSAVEGSDGGIDTTGAGCRPAPMPISAELSCSAGTNVGMFCPPLSR
jgi:hypothetical protein